MIVNTLTSFQNPSIKKYQSTKNNLPKIDNYSGQADIKGSSVSFKGFLGVNIGTNYTLRLKPYDFAKKHIDSSYIKYLFPNGIKKFSFRQGQVGDCSLLAVVKGLSLNKKGQDLLARMIKVTPDYKLQVNFLS